VKITLLRKGPHLKRWGPGVFADSGFYVLREANKTQQKINRNRRTEIHLFGDVSEAVKFSEKLEGLP